jgi:WD40 repeat protein/serine/threonine protein kinase
MNELDIFTAALELTNPRDRSRYLDEACGAGPELRPRIEALLRNAAQASAYLESPLAGLNSPHPPATTDPPLAEHAGTQIGPYKLLQQIGEGGMGVVYMAEQTRPVQRKVALKVIKPGMDSRQVIARFEAERQALALMDHANIARVFDGGTTDNGRPYFVMELVHGVPITKYCDDNHLTLRERLELFVPVCHAIQHAHQKGIIHRDLKPSNVMITLYDGKPVPKVIDFGVAKATEKRLTERTLFTQYGTMVGTLEYMSPEQAEMSALGVDTRSDVYSLGVLLYELLTGGTPISRQRVQESAYAEILRIIKEEEPPRPSTRLSTSRVALVSISAKRQLEPAKLTRLVRGELDWIVMKALEKDRNRRYETADGLAADVQRYLRDEPVEACPPSSWYRFSKFARRHKRGLVTASIVAVAVVLTAAGSGALIWRANQELQRSLQHQERSAYYERIALAEREWGANNLSRMEQLLDDCPPKLRGWEWAYLKRLRYGALPPLRHESPAYCVAFSKNGQYLATSTKGGVVRLCRAATGQKLQEWQAHPLDAPCVEFSPDSNWLVSGGWDAKVKVWDVQKVLQGDIQAEFELEHANRIRVWGLAFSPDGLRLASGGGRTADEKGEVKVWGFASRRELFTQGGFDDRVASVRFSPDGRRLAAGGGHEVRMCDAQTGQTLWSNSGHKLQRVETVAFSIDGSRLASVAGLTWVHPDQEVKVWDVQTGRAIFSLRGHVGALRSVAFSPDGRRIASAGLDQTVKLWDAATGQPVLTLRGHFDNIFCLAFSPDGHRLASASIDRTVRIWDATPPQSGPEELTLRGHTGAVTDVAFDPADERRLASAGVEGTIRFWDSWSGKPLGELPAAPSAQRLAIAYSPDGQHLATSRAMAGESVRVWEVATAKEVCQFPRHASGVTSVAYCPDGRHVATAGFDATVKVGDATTGEQKQDLVGHDWPVNAVTFSPDPEGRYVASCGADSTVRVWEWRSGKALSVLEPMHQARVVHVAFSRDGGLLASASWDRTIKVWDTTTWKLVHDVRDPSGAAAQCVAFGPDRRRLAWGSTDGTVKVWDGPRSEVQILRGHTSWIQSVAFSRDGQRLASASLDGTVKVWNARPLPKEPAQAAEEPMR